MGNPSEARYALSADNDAISKRLVEARMSAEPLPDFPGELPDTLEQAYAIQAASIARWPDAVAGWKVAMLSESDRERLAAERLVGPVFDSKIHRVLAGSSVSIPVYEGGFAAVEAEFVLELGVSVGPSDRTYSDEELIDSIADVYCGAEIASSPMAVVNERGPTSIVSDFGNNCGVLVGPKVPDWSTRLPGFLRATVTIDDVVVGEKAADAIIGSPLQALRVLIGVSASRGIALPAGTLVSSGAITGVHDVNISSISRVDFGPLGWFDVTFEPIAPG